MLAMTTLGIYSIYAAVHFRPEAAFSSRWNDQIRWVLIGAVFFFSASLIDYKWIRWASLPLYLAGLKITDQMFWVPQTGSVGMGLSILSYNGMVHFGLIVDKKNVPLPNLIVQRFKPELEKLLMLTLLGAHTVEHAGEFSDEPKRSRALLVKPASVPKRVVLAKTAAAARRAQTIVARSDAAQKTSPTTKAKQKKR